MLAALLLASTLGMQAPDAGFPPQRPEPVPTPKVRELLFQVIYEPEATQPDLMRRGIAIAEASNDEAGLAACQLVLARILPGSAAAEVSRLLDACEPKFQAWRNYLALNQLSFTRAMVAWNLSKFDEAERQFRRAVLYADQLQQKARKITALQTLAKFYSWLGAAAKAEQTLLEAKQLADDLGAEIAAVEIEVERAYLLYRVGKTAEAVGILELALVAARDLGNKALQANVRNSLAICLEALGKRQEAVVAYREAIRLGNEVRSEPDSIIYSNLASLLVKMGEHRQAESVAMALIQTLQSDQLDLGLARCYYELGRARFSLGQTATGILLMKQAVNMFQGMRKGMRAMSEDIQKGFKGENSEIYRGLADALISVGRLKEAEDVMNLLKEEELFNFIRRRSGSLVGTDEVSQTRLEEDWGREREQRMSAALEAAQGLSRLRGELAGIRRASPVNREDEASKLAEIKSAEEAIAQGKAAWREWLMAALAAFEDKAKAAVASTSLNNDSALQDLLRDLNQQTGRRAVVATTYVAESKIHLVVTSAEGRAARTVQVDTAKLNQLVARFLRCLKDPRLDPRPAGKELYDLLYAPIQGLLTASSADMVMWRLDGVFRYIPIAALWDGEKYLIERREQAIYTSVAIRSLGRSPAEQWSAAGFAASKGSKDQSFLPLPNVGKEIEAIIGTIGGSPYVDEKFSRQALLDELKSERHPIVHIATHFRLKPGNTALSVLLLGDGSVMSLAEFDGMQDQALRGVEVLALSACETGLAAGSDGSEIESFAALVQQLGAKSVLSSLWQVDDLATRYLMQEFYMAHRKDPKLTKAQALRLAQLSLISGQVTGGAEKASRGTPVEPPGTEEGPKFAVDPKKPFAHPCYWAAFVLSGNWR